MGVLSLWPLLEAARETCDLQSLSGLTLAVDLSGWICEACALRATMGKVNKPHLRTLFFRVALLYRLDVKLVFVCDGSAVELKYDTIAKRIDARNGRTGGQGAVKSRRKCNRSQLNRKVKECVDLLSCLGIPTIKANGEAEALCALLNAAGVVDGCITEDSDAFLYGATVIYRGISTSPKEMEVSRYAMSEIKEKVGFNRRKLVSLALLLGCDYLPHGIPGVGKETVLKLLQCVPGDILDRFDFWTQCRGRSSEIIHTIETRVCRKALDVAGFPFPEVTSEYLSPGEALPTKAFSWVRPQLNAACNFLALMLEWPRQYAYDKMFPLLSNWHLKENVSLSHLLQAHVVLKACVRAGMPCYDVVWRGSEARRPPNADDAASSSSADSEPEWMTSIERRDLVESCHPLVAEQFIAQQECLKKAKKAGTRKKAEKKACKSGDGEAGKENEPIEHVRTAESVQPAPRPVEPTQVLPEPAPDAVKPAPTGISLRDRLKRPARSETRTLDACASRSSEATPEESYVYVAPSNPFKLHDESMEVIRARGFEHALANLDSSMANVSLHNDIAAGDDASFASPAEVRLRPSYAPSTTGGGGTTVSSPATSAHARDTPPSAVERALRTELDALPSASAKSVADPSPAGDVGERRTINEKAAGHRPLPLAERLRQRQASAATRGAGSAVAESRREATAADSPRDIARDPAMTTHVEKSQHVSQDRLWSESHQLFGGRHESSSRHEMISPMARRTMGCGASVPPSTVAALWTMSQDDSFVMGTSASTPERPSARPRALSVDSPAAGLPAPLHSEPLAHGRHEQWMLHDTSMDMSFSFAQSSPAQHCAMEESFGLTQDAHLLASLASSTPAKPFHLRQQERPSRVMLAGTFTPGMMSPCLPAPRSLLQMDTASPMSDSMALDVGLLATLADGSPASAVGRAPGPSSRTMWGRPAPGPSSRTMLGRPAPGPSTSAPMWGSSAKPIVID